MYNIGVKARKIGGSIFLHVPASLARRHRIADGDVLDFDDDGTTLVLRPRPAVRRLLESWEPLRFDGPPPTLGETTEDIRREREDHE